MSPSPGLLVLLPWSDLRPPRLGTTFCTWAAGATSSCCRHTGADRRLGLHDLPSTPPVVYDIDQPRPAVSPPRPQRRASPRSVVPSSTRVRPHNSSRRQSATQLRLCPGHLLHPRPQFFEQRAVMRRAGRLRRKSTPCRPTVSRSSVGRPPIRVAPAMKAHPRVPQPKSLTRLHSAMVDCASSPGRRWP